MRTEIKNRKSYHYSKVALLLATIMLFAFPDGAKAYDYETVEAGDTLNVNTAKDSINVYGTVNLNSGADVDCLMVYGTVNMNSGSRVNWIYAMPGCTVNIYGGEHGNALTPFILVFPGWLEPDPVVTVYGIGFAVNDNACAPPPTEFKVLSGLLGQLTGTYCGGGDINLKFYTYAPVYLDTLGPDVVIDVKPGSDTNVINLKSKGVVPVAILTSDNFDAGTVDPKSVKFAQAAPVRWTLEDVDGDGDKDMLFHFNTQDLVLVSDQEMNLLSAKAADVSASAAKKATLTGKTADGYQVNGSDSVKIVSSKK